MRKIAYLLLLACGITLQSEAQSTDSPEKQPVAPAADESSIPEGYVNRVSLFNGKDLDGWATLGQGEWDVVDGAIRGVKSSPDDSWGHLITNSTFADSYVRLRYKLVKGNSGVYVRGAAGGRFGTYGMQIDLGDNRDGKPMVVIPQKYYWLEVAEKNANSGKFGEWNLLEVETVGQRLRVWVNGNLRLDAVAKKEEMAPEGNVALQLHAGKEANEFYFKDIEVFLPEEDEDLTKNLIKNSSFEQGSKGDHWIAEDGVFERHHSTVLNVECKHGQHYAELASAKGYKLTQTVDVEEGEEYELKFYSQARPRANQNESLFHLKINGELVKEITPEFEVWNEYQFTIKATSDTIKVSFEDQHVGSRGIGAMVDQVSITKKGSADSEDSECSCNHRNCKHLTNGTGPLRFTYQHISPEKSESCAIGDFNGDGHQDIATGSNWVMGPDFKKTIPFRKLRKANRPSPDDFTVAKDVDGDGYDDIVSGGHDFGLFFYKNPGATVEEGKLWERSLIDGLRPEGLPDIKSDAHNVCYHSGIWVDIDNDGLAQEILSSGARVKGKKLNFRWVKYEEGSWKRYDIGFPSIQWGSGVGDINGDGRADIVCPSAWFEAPENPRTGKWKQHLHAMDVSVVKGDPEARVKNAKGATCGHVCCMHVFDVNEDGLNDFMASSGHGAGIFWYEQKLTETGERTFVEHTIDKTWAQAHNLHFRDMDLDGDPDLIAGKRWDGWGPNSKGPNGLYWYELTPGSKTSAWTRHIISYDQKIGYGTGGDIKDIDEDGDLDIAGTTRQNGCYLLKNQFNPPKGSAVTPRTDLFNGKDLTGWSVKCAAQDKDKTFWKADNGAIVCDSRNEQPKKAVWLQSDQEYGDFELVMEMKADSSLSGNSGIQVRSRYDDAADRIAGPQIDFHPPAPWRTGLIYEETPGWNRWVFPPRKNWKIDKEGAMPEGFTWKADDWNRLRVICRGNRITTWVNGIPTADLDGTGILDDTHHQKHKVGTKGHVFLQLHGGSKLHIQFRNISIRSFKKDRMTHNVYIWLNPENTNLKDRTILENQLDKLISNSNISAASWGKSADTPKREVTDKSFHYGINMEFESVEDHNKFQVSREHDEFIKACGHMLGDVKVFDVATN